MQHRELAGACITEISFMLHRSWRLAVEGKVRSYKVLQGHGQSPLCVLKLQKEGENYRVSLSYWFEPGSVWCYLVTTLNTL